MVRKISSQEYLEWLNVPNLKDPFLIMGFQGWSNAADVATDSVRHLKDCFQTETVAALHEESFLHLTGDRPVAVIEEGLIREMEVCKSEISYAGNAEGAHDLVMFSGREPSIHWADYCGAVSEIISRLGIRKLFAIGGVQDTVSHSAQPLVTVVGSTSEAVEEAVALGPRIRPAQYHGPISIHSRLVGTAAHCGITAVSLWAHVPAYLQKSPKAVAAIITILNKASGATCAIDMLVRKSLELDRKIKEAVSKDPALKQYIEAIEGKTDWEPGIRTDNVIRLKDFLKRDSSKEPD
jgi:proteasome assembly chaperone (PAC2) family protein